MRTGLILRAHRGRACAIAALLLAVLTACAGSSGGPGRSPTPAPTRTPAQTATPEPSATPAITYPPGPQAVATLGLGPGGLTDGAHIALTGVDGRKLGEVVVPWQSGPVMTAVAPDGVDVVDNGRLKELTLSGRVLDLRQLPAVPNESFALSPDGSQLAYPVVVGDVHGSSWHNQLWVAPVAGGAPRLLADRTATMADSTSDAPAGWQYRVFGWTPAGIVIGRIAVGAGGDGPFSDEGFNSHTALVDPATGRATPLTDDVACPLSGLAADGTAVCFRSSVSHDGAVAIEIRSRDGALRTWSMSGLNRAGSAVLDSGGQRLAYATERAAGDWPRPWQLGAVMRVLDLRSGEAHATGPAGLLPLAWMGDGRVLAERWESGSGGLTRTTLVLVDPRNGAVQTLAVVNGDVRGVLSRS